MKKKVILFVSVLLFSAAARAQYESPPYQPPSEEEAVKAAAPKAPPRYYRYYWLVGGGASVPIGGHWGDKGAGFGSSPDLTVAGAKKVDDILSYGLETSYSSGHKNKAVAEIRVSIFSLTPFLRAVSREGDWAFFGVIGAGAYQWKRRAYSAGGESFSSASGSSFGVNMGGGVVHPFWDAVQLGVEFRWHHIFSVQGGQLDVGLINNIVPSAFVVFGF